MTTFVDGAATFAPISAPLRDWLREHADLAAHIGTVAEATAYALRSVLAHAAGAALGLAADPSDVRLTGADTAPPLWAPDPDTNRPRYVVTSTLTVQAAGI